MCHLFPIGTLSDELTHTQSLLKTLSWFLIVPDKRPTSLSVAKSQHGLASRLLRPHCLVFDKYVGF